MRRFFSCLVALLFSAPLFAASNSFQSDYLGKHPHPWTNLNFDDKAEDFNFAILADRNGGARTGVFERGVEAVNELRPAFTICVGDLMPGYSEDAAEVHKMRTEMNGILSKMQVPFFYVAGNHDRTTATMAPIYAQDIGPTYYHFIYKNALFLILSTEENLTDVASRSDLSDEEVAYAAKVLQENPSVRWTFVFMHKPLWDQATPLPNWSKVQDLLKDRKHTVFAGHEHHYGYYQRNGNDYIKLSTTGGGSGLTGPHWGNFDEVVWVAVRSDEPHITNINLDGILKKDVRTEKQELIAAAFNQKNGGLFIDPLWSQNAQFSKGTTTLRVVNTTSETLVIHATFEDKLELKVEPAKVDLTIAPNQTAKQELTVTADKEEAADELPMIKCSYDVMAKSGDKELPIARRNKALAVAKIYSCPPAVKPVTVDGRLDEWSELPYTAKYIMQGQTFYKGPEDANATFDTAYDDKFVYVAIKMTDDSPIAEPTSFTHESVALQLDARPESERAFGFAPDDPRGKSLFFLEMWLGAKGEINKLNASMVPEGTQYKAVRDGSTLTAEIAIPVSYLNAQQKKDWQTFRLDVGMQDMDKGQNARKMIWWQPRWNKDDISPSGSGTFKKEEK